jgi:hypothetical protein
VLGGAIPVNNALVELLPAEVLSHHFPELSQQIAV